MTERELQDLLIELLKSSEMISAADSFKECDICTTNKGVVCDDNKGNEFIITITS